MKMYLLAIDDTDNLESRGTGFMARSLAALLHQKKLARVEGITRHQLFVHDQIPYTSQNSSACLDLLTDNSKAVQELSCDYVLHSSAPGSDAAVAFAEWKQVTDPVIHFGNHAKCRVLSLQNTVDLAEANDIFLIGLTGEHTGMIGAMAGLGLRKGGDDGRFIWMSGKELRDLNGEMSITELKRLIPVDEVRTGSGLKVADHEIIFLGDWIRPVLVNGKSILIAEIEDQDENVKWSIAGKEYHKSLSS